MPPSGGAAIDIMYMDKLYIKQTLLVSNLSHINIPIQLLSLTGYLPGEFHSPQQQLHLGNEVRNSIRSAD